MTEQYKLVILLIVLDPQKEENGRLINVYDFPLFRVLEFGLDKF